jgi:tRNA G46 methylase TrmB
MLNPTPNAMPTLAPALTPIAVVEQDIQYRSYRIFSRNGRNFHAWKAGKYPFPCDRVARDNDDIVNAITHHYCYGTGGYDDIPLHEVLIHPLVGELSTLKRVLDLGCGSGLFVAQVAKSLPDAVVVGVDLVEGQVT